MSAKKENTETTTSIINVLKFSDNQKAEILRIAKIIGRNVVRSSEIYEARRSGGGDPEKARQWGPYFIVKNHALNITYNGQQLRGLHRLPVQNCVPKEKRESVAKLIENGNMFLKEYLKEHPVAKPEAAEKPAKKVKVATAAANEAVATA